MDKQRLVWERVKCPEGAHNVTYLWYVLAHWIPSSHTEHDFYSPLWTQPVPQFPHLLVKFGEILSPFQSFPILSDSNKKFTSFNSFLNPLLENQDIQRAREKAVFSTVNSIFSFSHNIFRSSLFKGILNSGLFGWSFPKWQILDASKLNEFEDDNFKFDENGRMFCKRVENTVGKEEIVRYKQFLLFPQCFQKTST